MSRPATMQKTWANVLSFTTIPSVREIVVLRSDRLEAAVLRRDPGGAWPRDPVTLGPDDRLFLPSIGFEAPIGALCRTTRFA